MPRKKDQTWETEQAVFPSKLSEIMKERQVSQEKLAKALGVKRQTVSLYKTGQSSPNVEQLRKIAEFFEVSADWFLGLSPAKTNDMDVKEISEQTGLSVESVEILRDRDFLNDFLVLLIDDLIYQSHAFQPSVRFAARYWVQGEIGDREKSKETIWLEKTLSLMRQNSPLRRNDIANSFAEIPAKDAGDFYRDRAIREIEHIALQSIEKYKETLRIELEKLSAVKIPDDLKKKMEFEEKIWLLASNATLKDFLGDEFKGVPELNELCEELKQRANSTDDE